MAARARVKPAKSAEAQEPLNSALRNHVSRYAFVLSLRPTHIAALVHIELMTRLEPAGPRLSMSDHLKNGSGPGPEHRRGADPDVRLMAHLDSHFVPGVRGLIDRGLVTHQRHERDPWEPNNERPFGDFYAITSAGLHVFGLLKAAGLWQSYLDSMPWLSLAERSAA